jgi:hypothetical protein
VRDRVVVAVMAWSEECFDLFLPSLARLDRDLDQTLEGVWKVVVVDL